MAIPFGSPGGSPSRRTRLLCHTPIPIHSGTSAGSPEQGPCFGMNMLADRLRSLRRIGDKSLRQSAIHGTVMTS
jgi:hypothetical protein